MPVDLRFSVLGPLRAWRQEDELDTGQPRQRAVLSALLLREGAPASLSELVDDVWGEHAPASAIGSIRTYIYRLRRELGTGRARIRSADGGYTLAARSETLDLNAFKHLVSLARTARTAGDLTKASGHYTDALTLWTGPALAGVPGPYADLQRTRLSEMRLASVEARLTCDTERGLYVDTAAELSALVAEYPLRERLSELLMTALYGAGRQSEALTVFHTTSHLLRERLGVSPSAGLQKIHELILANELTLPHRSSQESGASARVSRRPRLLPVQLPPGLPYFVGRDGALDEVSRLARPVAGSSPGSAPAVCVVGGLAGVGKTAFAVRLAHRLAEDFPDGQLFSDLRGFGPDGAPRDPAHVLAQHLEALGVPPERIPAGTEARSVLFRGLLARRRVLVLLDNAQDEQQVRPLLPGSGGSLAVVTSRNQLPGLLATHQAVPVTLRPLGVKDAHELLRQRIGGHRVEAEPDAACRIVAACGRLPLALSVVAARAAYLPGFPLAAVADELSADSGCLGVPLHAEDPLMDLRAVFSWSYRVLDPGSAALFRLLSVHPGPDITPRAAAALTGRPVHEARVLLRSLTRGHLLTEHAPGRYCRHDVPRSYAAELAREHESPDERDAAFRRLLGSYLSTARIAAALCAPGRQPQQAPGPVHEDGGEPLSSREEADDWFTAELPVLLALAELLRDDAAFACVHAELGRLLECLLDGHAIPAERRQRADVR